jgi:hypothetical protein
VRILIISWMFFQSTGIHAQGNSILWSNPIDMTRTSSSTDALFPVVLCDQYQNTHILWADRSDFPTLYYMSDALGEWSAPIDVITNSNQNNLIIRLSSVIDDNQDVLHLLWVDLWIKGVLYYSQVPLYDATNPRAWMKPIPLAVGTENGSIDIDKDGNLYIFYGVSSANNLEVGIDYIKSLDKGRTWSTPINIYSKKVPFPSDPHAEIAIDGMSRIHVGVTFRSQDYGKYSEIGYIQSMDGGQSWSEYELIDNLGTAWQGVSTIAPYAVGDDVVHLTWHDPRRMHRWSNDGGRTWSEPDEIMNLGAAFGGPNAITEDSAGNIFIVTAVNGGVYSASWDGSMWRPPERIEDREIDPHGQDIAICQGNKLQVVYDDRNDTQSIWYSSRIVDSPRIEQQPIPVPNPILEVSGSNSPSLSSTESTPEFTEQNNIELSEPLKNTIQAPGNPLTPLVISSGTVLALIVVVIVLRRK